MTPEELATEYLRREKAGHATMEGANIPKILDDMCEEFHVKRRDLVQAVLDHTISGAS